MFLFQKHKNELQQNRTVYCDPFLLSFYEQIRVKSVSHSSFWALKFASSTSAMSSYEQAKKFSSPDPIVNAQSLSESLFSSTEEANQTVV